MTSPTSDRRQGLVGNTPFKAPVLCATSASIALSAEQLIDGVQTSQSRVLVKGQADVTQNGIYDTSSAAWTRSLDADGNYDLAQGTMVYIAQGSQAGQIWSLRTTDPIVIGTSGLSWAQVFVGGSSPSAPVVVGNGITDTSAEIAVANALGLPILFFGVSVVGTPTTITIPIVDTMAQIFTAASQVTIANGLPVRPEWWGIGNQNTIALAIQALPGTLTNGQIGGVVQLELSTYLPNNFVYGFGSTGKNISKPNITIRGRKMPQVSADCKSLVSGTGTIVQGPLFAFANNIEITDLGVDSGFTVCGTYNGGNYTIGSYGEGLELTYPNDAAKAANASCQYAHLHNIIVLSFSPTASVHAFILGEGYSNVRVTGEMIAIYGLHGAAIKCADFNMDKISTYLNGAEGVVFKTDTQTTAICERVMVSQIACEAGGPIGTTPYVAAAGTGVGLSVQALGGSIDQVQLGIVRVRGYPIGLQPLYGGNFGISALEIGMFDYDGSGAPGSTAGMNLSSSAGQSFVRGYIGSFAARNCTYGAQVYLAAPADIDHHLSIGRLTGTSVQNVLDIGAQSYVLVDQVIADTAADAVYHIVGTPSLKVGMMSKDAATPAVYSTTAGGLAPSLTNSWAQVAGNDPFGIDLVGGKVSLRGLIRPGTTNGWTLLPQWAWPVTTKRGMALGNNAGTVTAVPVTVQSDGHCFVNELAGGTANCTTYLSLSGFTYDLQA